MSQCKLHYRKAQAGLFHLPTLVCPSTDPSMPDHYRALCLVRRGETTGIRPPVRRGVTTGIRPYARCQREHVQGLVRQFRNSLEVLVLPPSTLYGELNNDFRVPHPIPAEKLKSPRYETAQVHREGAPPGGPVGRDRDGPLRKRFSEWTVAVRSRARPPEGAWPCTSARADLASHITIVLRACGPQRAPDASIRLQCPG